MPVPQSSSGWFQTPNNTPYGRGKINAVDNPYLTKDSFILTVYAKGLGITATSADGLYASGELDNMLLEISGEVNRYCRRWFDTQTIDEIKTGITVRPWNPQLVTVLLQNSPYNVINSIYFQVLKWFIQIDSNSQGYLQDFPDLGFYKIVPLLSNSGTGVGSPMPAEIVDKTPLGVIWTNYTFGYGNPQTGVTLSVVAGTSNLQYQSAIGNRLWAPSQTVSIYANGVLQTTGFSVNYANGLVTFNSAPATPVTASFTSNETVPADIKRAVAMLTADAIAQMSNPTGATSLGMQTFNVSYGPESILVKRAHKILDNYAYNIPTIL
jgi:hypothetical protein